MKPSLASIALTLLIVLGTSLCSLSQWQNGTPRPVLSRANEMLERWNDIGNKLIAMAQDFPENKL